MTRIFTYRKKTCGMPTVTMGAYEQKLRGVGVNHNLKRMKVRETGTHALNL